jgi:hypothetical protein
MTQEWGGSIAVSPKWGNLNRFTYYHEPETFRKTREIIERNTFNIFYDGLANPRPLYGQAQRRHVRRWLASKLMSAALKLDSELDLC